jgi:hypothetical protein
LFLIAEPICSFKEFMTGAERKALGNVEAMSVGWFMCSSRWAIFMFNSLWATFTTVCWRIAIFSFIYFVRVF